ncbi:hypothetical protein [Nocardioides sp.]|uniref:hypothetical protein n=1 Tax=Nocardioides sp. TaxID=35761 RepID=UPI0027186BB2|nr:hypothetical protein [Nocardioides sp.]MDO9454486.1 hypothetical protein [Nocardioides sp.]
MSSRVLVRVLLSVLAGAVCGVGVACGVLVLDEPEQAEVAVTRPVARPSGSEHQSRAREALRAWDAARARAWTSGDPEALARLYTPGSVAGERDAAMLRAWTDRGARVTGLTTQVLRLRVELERDRRLVLVVTDRVAQVSAAGLDLPRDRPSTRRIVLVRAGRGTDWQVASVSAGRSR